MALPHPSKARELGWKGPQVLGNSRLKIRGDELSHPEHRLAGGTEPVGGTGCPLWGPAVGSHRLEDACHIPAALRCHGPQVVPWLEATHTAQVQRASSGHQSPRAPTSSSLSAPGQPQFSTILAANLTGSNERNAAVTSRCQLLPGHPQGARAESQDPQTQGPDLLRAADRVEAQRETEVPPKPSS